MKTKPASPTKIIDVKSEVSAPAPQVNPIASVDEKINRISIPLTKDGKIEWDSMRTSTKEKVKSLMGVSDGATATATKIEAVEVFDPAWTGTLFDTIGKIEAFAAGKLYKMSPEIADKCFSFSQAEKDKLAGPTAKVINKYAPVWLEKFKDEIALAGLFVTMTAIKFQMASMMMQQQAAAQNMRERAKVPEPPPSQPEAASAAAVS